MMAAQQLHPSGIPLGDLLAGIADAGDYASVAVNSIALDSRRITPGALFLALAGHREHGIAYLDQALAQGAVAVLADNTEELAELPAQAQIAGRHVPLLRISGLGQWVGSIAERFYGEPSQALQVIGITGTNGKTSVSHFIAQALQVDAPCGIIGTLGSGLPGALTSDSGRTTPDAVSVHARLAEFRDQGIGRVVMEVSSHGLEQHRVGGVNFSVAVFTNLSHEHLDYHGNMDNYAAAKRRLFMQPGLRHAVLNLDDAYARAWLAQLPNELNIITYGLAEYAQGPDLLAEDIRLAGDGLGFRVCSPWGVGEVHSPLLGRFNVANLLATLGALLAVGVEFNAALARLGKLTTVAGRMEAFGGQGTALGVVDYAHTPDALEHVLAALREHCTGRLICVFGCGGERDRAKRPLMGEIAERLADVVIVTDDNPRSEDPQQIIDEILSGMQQPAEAEVLRERAEAIAMAHAQARSGDVVLVAGKGHEEVQQIGEQRLPFSDRALVRSLFGAGGGHG